MRRFALTILTALNAGAIAFAADHPGNKRYFPVDVRRPGMAAQWNLAIDPTRQGQIQLVEVSLPQGGSVALYQPGGALSQLTGANRAQLQVGGVYRFKVSGLADLPGVELYPTVELIDHMHAPPGTEQDFPVPIEITAEDLEAASEARLVTKVVYLEQPDLAIPAPQDGGLHTTDFSPSTNLLQMADQRGRPVAIIRIGGRQPDLNNPDSSFYSTNGAVIVTEVPGKVSLRGNTNGNRIVPRRATPAEQDVLQVSASQEAR